MKVKNMTSARGNKVANQFIITDDCNIEYFQSYNSLIAVKFDKFSTNETKVFLDKNTWDYSRTTGKYRNEFLGEGIAETRAKIKKGIYKLWDLNSDDFAVLDLILDD